MTLREDLEGSFAGLLMAHMERASIVDIDELASLLPDGTECTDPELGETEPRWCEFDRDYLLALIADAQQPAPLSFWPSLVDALELDEAEGCRLFWAWAKSHE